MIVPRPIRFFLNGLHYKVGIFAEADNMEIFIKVWLHIRVFGRRVVIPGFVGGATATVRIRFDDIPGDSRISRENRVIPRLVRIGLDEFPSDIRVSR